MELQLPRELEGRLAAAASRRGVSLEALAREALERAVDYEDWFLREVEAGLAQVDAGQTLRSRTPFSVESDPDHRERRCLLSGCEPPLTSCACICFDARVRRVPPSLRQRRAESPAILHARPTNQSRQIGSS
jgi:predicted transcriptional regulator